MSTPIRSLPSLDVVIPCYNEHDSLPKCLDALLEQKDELRQIILVDNNSTDDTAKIIKDYQKKHPKLITYLFEKQQGTQYARNKGFDVATAEVIGRIDADALVQPHWARAIREAYATHPEFMAASGKVDYYDLPFRKATGALTWLFIFVCNTIFTRSNSLYGSNMTIRTATWKKIKDDVLMEDHIMEDMALVFAINRAGLYIGHVSGSLASASGRRLRNTPSLFWKYNSMWWRTYQLSGYPLKAAGIRVIVWLCNIVQALCWVVLLFHDPITCKWRIARRNHDSNYDRILP